MSSSTLAAIQTQLNFYAYPVFMTLGSIGNILIVVLFRQQSQSACSIYLITSAIMNILYLLFTGFFETFVTYGDRTIREIMLCKISTYITGVIGQVTKTMLVFACIDRYLITSTQVNLRAISTPKRAKYLIFFAIIFWLIAGIHAPIMLIVVYGQCIVTGIYATISIVYATLFVGLIPSITLSVFGYLSYRNMRQLHNRIQPIAQGTNNANYSIRRKDRDLLIIVISEIFLYVITSSLFPLVLLEMMITQYVMPNKNSQYSQAEIFTFNISLLLLFIFSTAHFYTYLISSKSFRRDFKKLIIKSYWKLRRRTLVQTAPSADKIVIQQDTRV